MRHGVTTALGRVLPPECYTLPRLWRQLLSSSGYADRVAAVRSHNEAQPWSKRGIVVTPVRWVG
jgi:xanthine dehydrogenase molybdopterin-binding subunit B